jgi:REP element-mobilizing transposase RayT
MSNHIHLVVSARNEDTSDILRDFKKFTGKQIIKAISKNKSESRKKWMLQIFKEQGEKYSRNSVYQFWRQDNQLKELFSIGFTWQKMNCIQNNPVESGLVEKAEDYRYSSARDYVGKGKGLLEIHPI